jgi:protein ImuB
MGEQVAVASADAAQSSRRRVAAVVLPELLEELAVGHAGPPTPGPLGVVVVEQRAEPSALPSTAILDGANAAARRLGVRKGQTLNEARALASRLVVHQLGREQIIAALGRVAEAALGFGAPVAIAVPGWGAADEPVPDTVWVEVSGSAHLFGGESALLTQLGSVVRGMGHVTRVAAAEGPRLAQALARWSPTARRPQVKCALDTPGQVAALPVACLPLPLEQISWLVRLGILTWGDLAELPRASAAARLGEHASEVLDLCEGRDQLPLTAYEPVRVLEEVASFDDALSGLQPLLFALRGLVYRISARLAGRGEAAQELTLQIQHDAGVARFRRVAPLTKLDFELASPLWKQEELFRVVVSRLEKTELLAPTAELRLLVPVITRAVTQQLELGRVASGLVAPQFEALPVLLAELAADVGKQQVGVLECVDSHRPEAKSRLAALVGGPRRARRSRRRAQQQELRLVQEPTRLFSPPVPLRADLRVGATLTLGHELYSIERLSFEYRLDGAEWWSSYGARRDYLRLWLAGAAGGIEALVFVDRKTGARFLQAIVD